MNYQLNGTDVHYFHKEGITSLTTMLEEMADWLRETNAYVEDISFKYVSENDYWCATINHSGTITNSYEDLGTVNISWQLARLKKVVNEIDVMVNEG